MVRLLARMWSRDQLLARQIEFAAMQESSGPEIVESRAAVGGKSSPSVRVTDPRGAAILLHSRFDPQGDADAWVQSLDPSITTASAVILIGFGLGYHVRSLLAKLAENARLFVFEPDARLLWLAINRADASDVLGDDRLSVLTTIDKPKLLDEWMKQAVMLTAAPPPVEHPASVRRNPELFQQAARDIAEVISFLRTSVNTVVVNGKTTASNIISNLAEYVRRPGLLRLQNKFLGMPAIVVAAGPSLRKNMHELKRAQGKAVIIAVQTSFQPLLDFGIRPHFVTSLDYHEISARFFERVPPNCETELVVEPKATPRVPALHTGPITFAGSDYADDLLREIPLDRPRLRSGATVAHLSFYLAEFLGCSTIIMVGQDLSFSDGVFYMPGTMHEDVWRSELSRFGTMEMKQWEMIARDRAILRPVPATNGGVVWTEERMFSYLKQFERDFANSKARVIDATEGGALKAGATPMTLADAINTFCTSDIPAVPNYPVRVNDSDQAVARCLQNRIDEANQIVELTGIIVPLLEVINRADASDSEINRAIALIDQHQKRLKPLARTYEQIMLMSQQSELERCRADIANDSGAFEGRERQQMQAKRDIANMRAIGIAASEFADALAGARGRVCVAPDVDEEERTLEIAA